MDLGFKGEIGIVTAAGSGIGRQSAITFANEGAIVVVSDINKESGQETVDMIKHNGGEATFIYCDVSQEEQVKSLVAETVEKYGRLDWAHNNAAFPTPTMPFTEISTEAVLKTFDVDVFGMFFSLKYEIEAMLKTGGGTIVNTASIVALKGIRNLAPFSAAKHAVAGLTRSLALEYGKQNIRVNAVCPGTTRTAAIDKWFKEAPDQAKMVEEAVPMGHIAEPEDQANAAVWLCSNKAAFITGVCLNVDGGELVQ